MPSHLSFFLLFFAQKFAFISIAYYFSYPHHILKTAISQVKKFKDALAKHSPDRCSIEPVKGLEEKELLALAANKELNFTYKPKTEQPAPIPAHEEIQKTPEPALASHSHNHPPLPPKDSKDNKTLVSSGR